MKKGGWPIGGNPIGGPLSEYPVPDFSFKAPWPRGTCLRAGGIIRYAESFVIPIYGSIITLIDQWGDCGFGAYGLYYGQPPTHLGGNRFAIDFTGYYRGVLYASDVPVTPAVAAHDGVVTFANDQTPYGLKSGPASGNSIHLDHLTSSELSVFLRSGSLPQGTAATGGAFRTRYLHLSPGFYVSYHMYLPQGTAMAIMDDTGNSSGPHLHFSLHYRDQTPDGAPYYSVPLQNFEGRSLTGDNDGDCICSSNDGPPPMGPIS